jgi:hypothetical protein
MEEVKMRKADLNQKLGGKGGSKEPKLKMRPLDSLSKAVRLERAAARSTTQFPLISLFLLGGFRA